MGEESQSLDVTLDKQSWNGTSDSLISNRKVSNSLQILNTKAKNLNLVKALRMTFFKKIKPKYI